MLGPRLNWPGDEGLRRWFGTMTWPISLIAAGMLPGVMLGWPGQLDELRLWVAFAAVAIVGGASFRTVQRHCLSLIVSPAFLAACSAFFLYGLLQYLLPPQWLDANVHHARAMASHGVEATLVILLFAGLSFAGVGLHARMRRRPLEIHLPLSDRSAYLLAGGACAASLFHAWRHGAGLMANPFTSEFIRQANDAAPVVAFMALGILAMAATDRAKILPLFMICVCAVLTDALVHRTIKIAFIGLAVSMVAYLITTRRNRKLGIVVSLLLAVVVGAMFTVIVGERYGFPPSVAIGKVFKIKIGDRSAATHMCLARVMERDWASLHPNGPLYFVAGLVPRVLWPEKPSLSNGADISVRYCDTAVDPANPGSMSVTLLGEPIMMAGQSGFWGALAVLEVGLLSFAATSLRFGGWGVALMVGLSPWLVDFDQSFAMYLANGVKAMIVGTVLITVIAREACRVPQASLTSGGADAKNSPRE